jgi:hypothetical protein
VQVCFYAVHPLIFPFTYSLSFLRIQYFWDSSMQYNLFGGEHLVTAHKRPPSRAWTSLWALNGVRFFRSFPPHFHSHFISHFSPVLIWTFIMSMRTAHPLSQTRSRSRVAPYIPMRSLIVAGDGNCVVPGSSCSSDVLCTWASAPTGAQSISFCLLHFYGLRWPWCLPLTFYLHFIFCALLDLAARILLLHT